MTKAEVNALANCNPQSHIIGVLAHGTKKSEIIMISRDDVNCWQLFLRYFNLGKLAHTRVYLSEITPYLKEYKWSDVSKLSRSSNYHQAYLKVCDIANKSAKRGDFSLFNNVVHTKVKKEIQFSLYHGSDRLNRFNVVKHIRWNPMMDHQTLTTLLNKEFPRSVVQLKYPNGSYGPVNKWVSNFGLSESNLKKMNILIEQRIPRSELGGGKYTLMSESFKEVRA